MWAESIEEGTNIALSMGVPTENGWFVQDIDRKGYELTEFAHQQLAERLGIPSRYYEKMREDDLGELLADNINAWVGKKNYRLVRILDGKIRAILSNRYRIMDHYDMTMCSMEIFKEVKAEIHTIEMTETRMYIKAVLPHIQEEIREGDKIIPGVVLRNSEVGHGRFSVEPFILRLVCKNGMIGESRIAKVHLGKVTKSVEILSSETITLENQALYSAVKDVIRGTFNPEVFGQWVERLRSTTKIEIRKPAQAVDSIVAKYKIDDDTKKELLNHFIDGIDNTQYGLINAITRTGRDKEDVEEKIKFERIGGIIANMNGDRFEKLMEVD